ncbi:DUF3307 domain-containing protein [Solitalea canadensis]|uniref:DUF3307 domain-containing protein n=1 Tax=Solitalea canadensis (strain ATCC 29591 / DSM 3403 / JCM 21819 / LMG 8368 / NBRC 15130 / NCIMB 12057 / USAM 9D) TaxID=929556 RepID=H8KTI5_SOLCM|nr:DUF3307 domain-containing protein [Solitalea canadensis]AFD06443.1 Protein of unknown function (DUF3307) [Solitalea canadensis DSM 3403]
MHEFFTSAEGVILIRLIIAHLLTDFIFQPKKWVDDKLVNKGKSKYLYFHTGICFLTSWIAIGSFSFAGFGLSLLIAFSHLLIDLWKIRQLNQTLLLFIIDQVSHLIVLLFVWLTLINSWGNFWNFIVHSFTDLKIQLIITAYILVIWPMGIIISMATKYWRDKLGEDPTSLENAGKWIGIFERILILTFVLTQQLGSIGFLIAAKSILRFSDKDPDPNKARKQTEYVLIGTLISFSLCILVGLGVNILIAK